MRLSPGAEPTVVGMLVGVLHVAASFQCLALSVGWGDLSPRPTGLWSRRSKVGPLSLERGMNDVPRVLDTQCATSGSSPDARVRRVTAVQALPQVCDVCTLATTDNLCVSDGGHVRGAPVACHPVSSARSFKGVIRENHLRFPGCCDVAGGRVLV